MKKRFIGILLAFAMLLNTIPVTALAAIGDLMGNTDAENKEILSQLSGFTGGSSDEAYALLNSLGLLDEEGNLNVSQSVVLDGQYMTLEEVMALLEDPGTDLSRIAEVDGTPVALGDLQTMIQIEQELARIRDTYFSDTAFTQEQLVQLESLMGQIESEGITANLLGAQDTDLVLSITPDPGNPTALLYSPYSFASKKTLKYNLTLTGTMPDSGTVGFSWRRVDGLMPDEYCAAKLALKIPGYEALYWGENSEFSFGPDDPNFVVTDASQVSGTLTVTIDTSTENPTLKSIFGYDVSGSLWSFIEFYNGRGLVFSDGTTQSDLHTIPITVSKPNAFEGGSTWLVSMTGVSDHDRSMTTDASGYNECTNPRWDLIDAGDAGMAENYDRLKNTAAEVFSGSSCYYKVNAFLSLYEPGVPIGYMRGALPVGYDNSSPSQRLTTVRYNWAYTKTAAQYDLRTIDLNSSPLRCVDGMIPYISTYPSLDKVQQGPIQYVSLVMASSGGAPYTLNTVWPTNPYFTEYYDGTSGSFSFTTNGKQRTISSSISIYDDADPTVVSVEIPAGTYACGQYVPILVTFSEPIAASQLTLNINNHDITASQLKMDTTGRKAVAMYPVGEVDDPTIHISGVKNLQDLTGRVTALDNNGGSGWDFTDSVVLRSTLMKNAVTGVSASPAAIEANMLGDGVTVTLALNQAEAYRTKYAAYNQSAGKAPFAVRITNLTTGESRTVDTVLLDSDGTISAAAEIADLSPAAADVTYQAEVIAYEDTSDTTGTLIEGKSATFTAKAVIFVDGVTVTYPTGDQAELSLTDTYRPRLDVSFTGSPTFTDGSWATSNPDIATIDANGQVILTGTAVGEVYFTFTAANGGLTDPDTGHFNSGDSKKYTVVAGDSPALVVPAEANYIMARRNAEAEVRWSSNSAFFSSDDFVFTVELFRGSLTKEQMEGETPVYTDTAEKTANRLLIPENTLSALSTNGIPAYTVRISMPHPMLSSETLSAVCYIVVNPEPAVVRLARPSGGLYLLDSQTAEIGWTIDHYVDGTTGDLRIEHIRTQNGQDVKDTVAVLPVTAQNGSYTLIPDEVDGLKDTYMVTLRARNSSDEGYSSDSFPLYAYHADALGLEVDGQKVTSLTMDNEGAVSGTLPTDTGDILALREELALIEYIGINYGDYSWSQLKDGIRWSTSDDDTVSVCYRQGGLYIDLSQFTMDTYLPETKMALSSVKDGTATITATHANTRMSASVTVDVHTLREKFYLFQLTPMQKTELSYTDGKGVSKTVETNDDGVLALYEPDGIATDIRLRATGGDGSVWLGTIYHESLLSGERDATRLQLYPLNTFHLRRAARVEIYLKKPDGSPYEGSLTLRGGVYKNDGYCQDAGILGNALPDVTHLLKDGKEAQTVTAGADGRLTVYMDSTQFWSSEAGESNLAGTALEPTDDIQYIFELTGMSSYYPLLVYANGNLTLDDLVRSAGSVVSLESSTGTPSFFVSNQTLDYGLSGGRLIDVRGSAGHIGPNEAYPEVNLITTVMLWGEDGTASDYKLALCDEYGGVPKAQSSRFIRYPFSSIPVVCNTLTLSKATVTDSGWIAGGRDAGLKARLSQGGVMRMELPLSPRVTDLTQVPKLTESDNITGMMLELQGKSGVGAGADMSSTNKIINGLMELMGELSGPVNGSSFKMLITPGKDNAVFNAFIWAGYDSLGLDEVDYDQNGLALDYKLAESNLSTAPSLNDLTDMAKGAYDPGKTYDEAATNQQNGKGSSSTDFGGQLEGYFEAQIQYNFEKGKWEIYVLGGGFTAGFGMSYTYTVNAQAGPVPLTATFNVGGSLQIDFKAAVRYSEQGGLKWASTVTGDSVNDYLTTLRINAYVNAFGGLGFDYSVVALKIGLFGKITFDNQNKFLSRTYLEDSTQRQLNGQALQLSGEVGIKFVAQFLFISYECVLASGSLSTTFKFNDWDTISDYWENTGSGLRMSALARSAAGSGLVPVSASATLQSRDYLERFARTWGAETRRMSLLSLDAVNALEPLQTNAYPYSLPLVSDDGQLLLYAFDNNSTDVGDTRIYAARLSGGSYPQGTEISSPAGFDGFGDSGLDLAGSANFAAAAWVRQSTEFPDKAAGQTMSSAEQALLMNGTEIVASVYDGTDWISTRLTSNASPDLAPAVAANGTIAIAAWRSVYSGDADELINFTQQDYILYSIYSGGAWSEPRQLYNGTSGAVKGIDAAMLADGTAAVVYTLDADSTDASSDDYEIGYAIVDTAGAPAFSAIITQDSWPDENPQVAAVKFAPGDERFILGWHSVRDGLSDIRLAAVDGGGALSNSFIESIAQAAGGSGVTVDGNFRFAKMSGDISDIGNLSLLWPESRENDTGETDHGILRAVKFTRDGSNIGISAALDVAELPSRTLLDHFDAYVANGDGTTVKAVIQGSEYKEIDLSDPDTYTIYQDLSGNDVYVANEEVKLFTATAAYENRVQLTALSADYANLTPNVLTPIQFTLLNAGMDAIDSVSVQIESTAVTFDNLDLRPNESKILTCWYPVGDAIENPDYTLTANFWGVTDTVSGTVYLDYPDLGISQLRTISEDDGIRTLQLTLYNGAAATLAGGKNRAVQLGFYDDALLDNIQSVSCSTPGITVNADKTLSISDEAALRLIDEGALTFEVRFDIGRYVWDAGLEEIPEVGIRLYANVWTEETCGSETAVLPEYYRSNNSASLLFESPLAHSGQPVSLSLVQGLSPDNRTTATVSLHNNSLGTRLSGNLIVSLLDGDGNVLERQQTYTGGTGSLIGLAGEETASRDFTFSRSGNRIMAVYGDMTLTDNCAELSELSFEGLAVRLSDFSLDGEGRYVCTAPDTTLNSTIVSFATQAPGASVTVNGVTTDGCVKVALSAGKSDIRLEVTSADGTEKRTYILSVNRVGTVPSSLYPVTVAATENGRVSISHTRASAGTEVSILVTSDDGYLLDALTVTDGQGRSRTLTAAGDGRYTFTMPADGVTVTATFWENPFNDVGETDWFCGAVKYVCKHGLMDGVGAGRFAPNATTTRAMLVTILYRLEGSPAVTGPNPFSDVEAGKWYTDAVIWAVKNGIVSGYGDGRFGPGDTITREQAAVILYNYAKARESSPAAALDGELIYPDGDKVSQWARTAAAYCQLTGIIQGDENGNFNPRNGMRRCETATILMRYLTGLSGI